MKNKSHTSGKKSLKIRKLPKPLQTYVCITAIILSLVLSLASCKKSTQSSDNAKYAGSTVYGKITEINGNYVKAVLGELSGNDQKGPGMDGMSGMETPPERPDGENGSMDDMGNPPERPDGEVGSMDDMGNPPERPDGEVGSMGDMGNPPELPDGESGGNGMMRPGGASSFTAGTVTVTFDLSGVSITKSSETTDVSGLSVDDIICLSFSASGEVKSAYVVDLENGGFPGGNGGNGGNSGSVDQGDSANTISSDGSYSGTEYISTGDNENALRIDGATVILTGVTVNKSAGASSNAENGDFYGVNAAVLATNGALLTISDSNISSSAQNGNGVFSYGSGTVVTITNCKIITSADNSGGIQTTGGGTTNAKELTIITSGNSSAAIRSDRGGGTVTVDGGSYTSNGYNSPAVYSTATITISNATLTANNSEALVIEGKNSIVLENCTVSGNMSDSKGSSSDINVHNIMIYQSMSGDADVGTSTFKATGGTITCENGDMFYVTNTHAVINLSGVTIVNKDDAADTYLMRVVGNDASKGWGTAGANGADVEFTASSQTLNGDIVVDTISTLDLTLSDGSVYTGKINIIENAEGGSATGNNAMVVIDSGCTWNLTGDCTLTSLTNNGTINYNGYTITLANGTVLGK